MLDTQIPLHDEQGNHRPHVNSAPRARVEVPRDKAILNDLVRGRGDIAFFASRFLGIEGNPGQIEWWNACSARDETGWGPKYLTTVVSAGNRAGKTLGMAILVLHHAFYKLGVRPPRPNDVADTKRWSDAPYEWYHVGPQQENAELVHIECDRILSGVHLAQKGRGCPLTETFGPIVDVKTKDRGEYLMLTFHAMCGGGRIHFRSAQDKAKALLGKDMNGISYDEASAELYLNLVYQEVFNLRRLSTGGPLHFIGTPLSGSIEYQDLWEKGNPANPNRDPQFASFRLPTWLNIGFGLDQSTYDAIRRQVEPYLIPQNLGGEFIEGREAYFSGPAVEKCFVDTLPEEELPQKDHRYVQGVDPGISSDPTWDITLDFTEKHDFRGVRAVMKEGNQTITAVLNMVSEGSYLYNTRGARCATMLDSTGMGGKMWVDEFSHITNLRHFDFGGQKSVKLKLLSDLKAVIDKGWLKLPRTGRLWGILRRQLLTYKLDDNKLVQDAVMALALAVRHALRSSGEPFMGTINTFGFGSEVQMDRATSFEQRQRGIQR